MGYFLPVQIYEVRIMPPTSSFLFGMEELRCHHSILTSEKRKKLEINNSSS